MVFMKSTIIYITVAISLLASQGQAAPMHGKGGGDIVHVSPNDGVVSEALGVDLGKQELENVKLSRGGNGGILPTKRGFLTRPLYRYGGHRGGMNYNYNGIGNGNGYSSYGFGRSNVGVNGFTRPIGFNGNGDDDSEMFDDVSAAKSKVKRDHHDHENDDINEALAIANQVTCNQPRPSHCQTEQDWHGYHGFMKRHDLDDISIGTNHHWGCPTIAPPCLPQSHGWGHTLDFDKRDEGAQAKDEGKSNGNSENPGASENKRDTNANVDANAVTEESVDATASGTGTASASTPEEELSKREWDEDHYGGGIWAGRRPGRYPGHFPSPYPSYGYPRLRPPYGYTRPPYHHYPGNPGYSWRGDDDEHDYFGDDREDIFDDHHDRFEEHHDRFEKRGHHDDEFDVDDFCGDDLDEDDYRRYHRGGYRHSPWGSYSWGGYRRGRGRYHRDDKRDQVTEQEQEKVVTESESTTDAPTIQKRDHVSVITNQNYNLNSGNRAGAHGEYYYGAGYEEYPHWRFMDEMDKRDHVDVYTTVNHNKDSFNQDGGYPDVWAFGGASGEFDKREESTTSEENKLSKRDHLNIYKNVNYNDGSFNSETKGHSHYRYAPYDYPPIYYGQDYMDEAL
ncbi:unnamed protein product [Cunninghamella echinulata]